MPKPLGDFLILDALCETGGTAIAVNDEELLADQAAFAARRGRVHLPRGRGLLGRGSASCASAAGSAAATRWSC